MGWGVFFLNAGSFRGVKWNTQTLFARKSGRQACKRWHALQLMRSNDFAGMQETRCSHASAKPIALPTGIRPLWSHDSARQAGVGLWIKESFSSKFNPLNSESCEELEAGRVAVLRLRGPQGGLDIFVVYHHTGYNYMCMYKWLRLF